MSCPATFASGPSCPHPVMRAYTRRGFRARHSSGPMPRRSVTPGRNGSTRASACSTMRSTVATPSGCFRSMVTSRRPRASNVNPLGRSAWVASSARSIRTTSAPMSDSNVPANGPGPIPASSMTLIPCSGPTAPPRSPHRTAAAPHNAIPTWSRREPHRSSHASVSAADHENDRPPIPSPVAAS